MTMHQHCFSLRWVQRDILVSRDGGERAKICTQATEEVC